MGQQWQCSASEQELAEQNACRARWGLAPLRLRTRRCIACDTPFQSIEQRTCGCTSRRGRGMLGKGVAFAAEVRRTGVAT